MANQLEVVNELRQLLDQIVLKGEVAYTDKDIKDNASSFFSDQDLIQRLCDATRFVVSQVRSETIPEYVDYIKPFEGSSDNAPLFYRLLGSRVDVGNDNAKRTTFGSIRKFHNNIGPPDKCNPIFVYEDYELKVYNGTCDPDESKAAVVIVPNDKIKKVSGPFEFIGGENRLIGLSEEDLGGLIQFYNEYHNNIFTTYIIYNDELNKYVLKDSIPLDFYTAEYYTIFIGCFEKINKNLEHSIIHYAYSSALGTLGLYEQSVLAQQRMLRDLIPYMYSRRNSANV